MCGRYALNASSSQVIEQFELAYENDLRNLEERIEKEVFPSKVEEVIVRQNDQNILDRKIWGAKKLVINGKPLKDQVNVATLEKLESSPLWSKALKVNRLLIPATSYFEWKEVDKFTTEKYEIYNSSNQIFAFAGINIIYIDADGKNIDCFVIITTGANEKIKNIHHRQPVIIPISNYSQWLSNETQSPTKLLKQFDEAEMNYKLIWSKSKKKKNENQPSLF
ncbi:hypothetical protein EHQ23_09090 [Leptospira bourretii]|uniref:Abasic site processing protein n=1 Tax=Leptospira bourretii TaxID=2484962 RepID=A0A4R9IL13_9LEPT|nr:SOS response-associated peptidase family protein [Leptospira bourretii]TGK84841.1 hypothetical protein EHQ23_09090 [Leptospira bourretii]TGK90608.1 hypothetical protein EHQ26_10690 [Leptospira bourretii]TGL36096.1 hypothetical protein EHQ45_07925 [Leptospira bourretii]